MEGRVKQRRQWGNGERERLAQEEERKGRDWRGKTTREMKQRRRKRIENRWQLWRD